MKATGNTTPSVIEHLMPDGKWLLSFCRASECSSDPALSGSGWFGMYFLPVSQRFYGTIVLISKSLKAFLYRLTVSAIFTALLPLSAPAGPLESQFRQGYEGVRWGTFLSALEESRPGGIVAPGAYAAYKAIRTYQLPDDRPLFGISRPGMKVSYGICGESVKEMRFYFPFSKQDELLKTLTGLFGRHRTARRIRSTLYYEWESDDIFRLSMQVTRDLAPGTLAVSIINEKEEYSVFPECGIPTAEAYGEPE